MDSSLSPRPATHTLPPLGPPEGDFVLFKDISEPKLLKGCKRDASDLDQEASNSDPTDSGYASLVSTPDTKEEKHARKRVDIKGIIALRFPRRPSKPTISAFPAAEIDEATRKCFMALRPQFERLLLEHVRASQTPGASHKPMSIRLMMMGVASESATAHIVIFCQPAQKAVIKKFLKNSVVQELCESNNPSEPSFKAIVIGQAPVLVFALSDTHIEVDNFEVGYCGRTTLCGLPIAFTHPSGGTRYATFGGLIKIVFKTGDETVCGITAGHALHDLESQGDPPSVSPEHPDKQHKDENKDGDEDEDEDDDSDVDFDLGHLSPDPFQDGFSYPPAAELTPWEFRCPIVLGSVVKSEKPVAEYYDWALFETSVYKQNKVVLEDKADLRLSVRNPGATGLRSILVLSAGGAKRGQLLPEPGRIILGPGKEFVETHMIATDNPAGISHGDSGAWVVDLDTFELYGHVVASDVFKIAYVMPMEKIFRDIKERLDAVSVDLAGRMDVYYMSLIDDFCVTGVTVSWPPSPSLPADDFVFRPQTPMAGDSDPMAGKDYDSGYASLDTTPLPGLWKYTPVEGAAPIEEVIQETSSLGGGDQFIQSTRPSDPASLTAPAMMYLSCEVRGGWLMEHDLDEEPLEDEPRS